VWYDGPDGALVDLLLCVRASYFVGNPASTFSWNAARVRAVAGLTSSLLVGVEYEAMVQSCGACSETAGCVF